MQKMLVLPEVQLTTEITVLRYCCNSLETVTQEEAVGCGEILCLANQTTFEVHVHSGKSIYGKPESELFINLEGAIVCDFS